MKTKEWAEGTKGKLEKADARIRAAYEYVENPETTQESDFSWVQGQVKQAIEILNSIKQ